MERTTGSAESHGPLVCAACGSGTDVCLDDRFSFEPLCGRCLRLRAEGLCVDCGNHWVAQAVTDDGDIGVDPDAALRCSSCDEFYRTTEW